MDINGVSELKWMSYKRERSIKERENKREKIYEFTKMHEQEKMKVSI